jgi:hypothetical protein
LDIEIKMMRLWLWKKGKNGQNIDLITRQERNNLECTDLVFGKILHPALILRPG